MSIKEWAKQVFIPYGSDLFLMGGTGGTITALGAPQIGGIFAGMVYVATAVERAIFYDSNDPPNFGYFSPQYGEWNKKAKDARAEGKELLIPDALYNALSESAGFFTKRSDRILEDVYRMIRLKRG